MGFAEFIIGPAEGRTRWLNPSYALRILLLATAFALRTPGRLQERHGTKRAGRKFSLRRSQTGRRQPLLHVGSRFSLSRPAEKPFALNAGRGAFRLFSQALRLVGQALIQW
jgi:hypothetical protein